MQVVLDLLVVLISLLIVFGLFHLYITKMNQYQEEIAIAPEEEKQHSFTKIANALFLPEVAFIRAFPGHIGEHMVKSNSTIPLLLVHFYFTWNLLYFLKPTINWQLLLFLELGTLALFFITSRVWAVYTMGKLIRFFKEKEHVEEKISQLTKLAVELHNKQREAFESLQPLLKKKQEEQQKIMRSLQEIQNRKLSIKKHEQYLAHRLQVVTYNLNKIYQLPDDVEIAIDSNVLMKCDSYLVKALSERGILISKRVQQEWDKNKTSADQQKAFRAREAIRRLISLENYRFVVSKWDSRSLQTNNLQAGVPDDEIIADYLYEQQNGKNLVIVSDDNNFIGSAKVHLPILQLKEIDLFTSN